MSLNLDGQFYQWPTFTHYPPKKIAMNKHEAIKYWNTQPVIIKQYKNNPDIYGGIVGIDANCIIRSNGLLVLQNLDKIEYDTTKDQKLFLYIPFDDIKSIEYQIKRLD